MDMDKARAVEEIVEKVRAGKEITYRELVLLAETALSCLEHRQEEKRKEILGRSDPRRKAPK